jgi:hypothetical protein
MPWPKLSGDKGSAVLEFVTIGLLLNVSVLTLAVQLLTHFQAQLAVESVARHVARAIAKDASALAVDELATSIAGDFSFRAEDVNLQVSCQPSDCDSLDSIVAVEVSIQSATAKAVIAQGEKVPSNEEVFDSAGSE